MLRRDGLLALLPVGGGGEGAEALRSGGEPLAIATFPCVGLYWSPEAGAANREVMVRYRRHGTAEWSEGLPMRYHPILKTDEDLADYRGSIVHLPPNTTYEIELTLAGTQTRAQLTATTLLPTTRGKEDRP